MGMALGHPHDWVSGSISTQSGVAQLPQMELVRVTVGQPVCEGSEPEGFCVIDEKMVLDTVEIGVEVTVAAVEADLEYVSSELMMSSTLVVMGHRDLQHQHRHQNSNYELHDEI